MRILGYTYIMRKGEKFTLDRATRAYQHTQNLGWTTGQLCPNSIGVLPQYIAMKAEIKNFINDRINAGKSYAKVRQLLLDMDHAKDAKEAEKFLKDAGVEKAVKRTSVIDGLYDYMFEAPRSYEDFETWIKSNGTDGTLKAINAHERVRVLMNKAHDRLAAEIASGPVEPTK